MQSEVGVYGKFLRHRSRGRCCARGASSPRQRGTTLALTARPSVVEEHILAKVCFVPEQRIKRLGDTCRACAAVSTDRLFLSENLGVEGKHPQVAYPEKIGCQVLPRLSPDAVLGHVLCVLVARLVFGFHEFVGYLFLFMPLQAVLCSNVFDVY